MKPTYAAAPRAVRAWWEVGHDADGLADILIGLVWGAAFQIGRSNSARAESMLDQLGGVLDQGLVR